MNINFDKTDRLIELIEDSCYVFTHFLRKSEDSLQKRRKNLYENLVRITASEKPEKQKQSERIKAFATEYKLENDVEKAEEFFKFEFDEEATLKYLTRAYWQIQNLIIFTDNSRNNFADKEGLKKLIEKTYSNEPCKDVIADVIYKQEPRIKDIEREFWSNCTDTDKINDFCNVYRERWKEHLKQIDEKYYSIDAILFNEKNELYHYFKELRLCGLLQQSGLYVEGRLQHIAREINYVCEKVVELFSSLRRSTKITNDGSNSVQLEQIFDTTKPGYSICLDLLKELEFVDDNGNTKPKVKANEILGLAVALKETSHNLLNDTYTDDQLMEIFQKHLKTSSTPSIKRRGKGYNLKKEEVKNYINRYMKKERAS